MSDIFPPLSLGTIGLDNGTEFLVDEELLKTHLGIFGGTRHGKSKLLELICRALILNRRGLAFIDPHSDTADDLLAFIAAHSREVPFVKSKLHYLKPSERAFSFDPFLYRPDPEVDASDSEFAYKSWLHTKIRDMASIIVRQQGETEEETHRTVRLRRWLINGLYAVGTRQNIAGTHFPLRDLFVFLNPHDPEFERKYSVVAPLLPRMVRADFQKLRGTKDFRKQEDWVESTLNRLREMISPIVDRIFNLAGPSIDFCEVVARGDIVLASLGKTVHFHEDDGLAIAGLLIRQLTEAIRTVERSKRKQFYFYVDEAHNYLGDDLIRLMKESGKYKLSFGLAVQGLDNLQKGQIDMVPTVLGQCGLRITFRQQFHEHAEILAKSLCYTMLDFTELLQETDRHDGYDFIVTPSVSFGSGETQSLQYGITNSQQVSVTESRGHGTTDGESLSRGVSRAETDTRSLSGSHSESMGTSDQLSVSSGLSNSMGRSLGDSLQISRGRSRDVGESMTTNESVSRSHQRSHSESENASDAVGSFRAEGRGEQETKSEGESRKGDIITSNVLTRTDSDSVGRSHNKNIGEIESHSLGTATSESVAVGVNHSNGESQGTSRRLGSNSSESLGINRSENESTSVSEQKSKGSGRSHSSSDSISEGQSKSVGITHSLMQTLNRSISENYSKSEGHSEGVAESKTEGAASSQNRSVSFQLTPLQKVRVDIQRTGRLQVSVQDQFAMHTKTISELPRQHCLVAVSSFNTAVVLRVGDVVPPFETTLMSEVFQRIAIKKFKEELYSLRQFYFKPGSDVPKEPIVQKPDDLKKSPFDENLT